MVNVNSKYIPLTYRQSVGLSKIYNWLSHRPVDWLSMERQRTPSELGLLLYKIHWISDTGYYKLDDVNELNHVRRDYLDNYQSNAN